MAPGDKRITCSVDLPRNFWNGTLEILAFLLPFGLIILGLQEFANTRLDACGAALAAMYQRRRKIIIAIFVILCAAISPPVIMNRFTDITTDEWRFWLQTITGNWSSDSFPPLAEAAKKAQADPTKSPPPPLKADEQLEFAVSANIAFWINNLIIFGLLGWVWRLEQRRNAAMQLTAAFAMRDTDIEIIITNAVASLLPEKKVADIRQVIQTSMDSATKHWEYDTLNSIYGPEKAERLRRKMKDIQIIP